VRAPSPTEVDDDEVARLIYRELHARDPSEKITKYITSKIEKLRASVSLATERPRPSEARRVIERAAELSDALAACLDDLGPEWQWYIRLMVFQEREHGVPLVAPGYTQAACADMDAWIVRLKELRHQFLLMQHLPGDFFSKPKKMCGWVAREIIVKLAPGTKLNHGEPFYSVTRLLWSTLSKGTPSVRRACDELVDLFDAHRREIEHKRALENKSRKKTRAKSR
jgi:hypothetical protein